MIQYLVSYVKLVNTYNREEGVDLFYRPAVAETILLTLWQCRHSSVWDSPTSVCELSLIESQSNAERFCPLFQLQFAVFRLILLLHIVQVESALQSEHGQHQLIEEALAMKDE